MKSLYPRVGNEALTNLKCPISQKNKSKNEELKLISRGISFGIAKPRKVENPIMKKVYRHNTSIQSEKAEEPYGNINLPPSRKESDRKNKSLLLKNRRHILQHPKSEKRDQEMKRRPFIIPKDKGNINSYVENEKSNNSINYFNIRTDSNSLSPTSFKIGSGQGGTPGYNTDIKSKVECTIESVEDAPKLSRDTEGRSTGSHIYINSQSANHKSASSTPLRSYQTTQNIYAQRAQTAYKHKKNSLQQEKRRELESFEDINRQMLLNVKKGNKKVSSSINMNKFNSYSIPILATDRRKQPTSTTYLGTNKSYISNSELFKYDDGQGSSFIQGKNSVEIGRDKYIFTKYNQITEEFIEDGEERYYRYNNPRELSYVEELARKYNLYIQIGEDSSIYDTIDSPNGEDFFAANSIMNSKMIKDRFILLIKAKKYSDGLETLKEGKAHNPKNLMISFNYSVACFLNNLPNEALNELESIKPHMENSAAWVNNYLVILLYDNKFHQIINLEKTIRMLIKKNIIQDKHILGLIYFLTDRINRGINIEIEERQKDNRRESRTNYSSSRTSMMSSKGVGNMNLPHFRIHHAKNRIEKYKEKLKEECSVERSSKSKSRRISGSIIKRDTLYSPNINEGAGNRSMGLHSRSVIMRGHPQGRSNINMQMNIDNRDREKRSKSTTHIYRGNNKSEILNSHSTIPEMLSKLVETYTGMEYAKLSLQSKGMSLPGEDHVFQITPVPVLSKGTQNNSLKPQFHQSLKKIEKMDEFYYKQHNYTESPIFAKLREFENFTEFSKRVKGWKYRNKRKVGDMRYSADDMSIKRVNRRSEFASKKYVSTDSLPVFNNFPKRIIKNRVISEEISTISEYDEEEREEKARENRFKRGRDIISQVFCYVGVNVFERCAEKSLTLDQRKLKRVLGITAMELKRRNAMAKVMLGGSKKTSRKQTTEIITQEEIQIDQPGLQENKLIIDGLQDMEEETDNFLDFVYEFEGVKQRAEGSVSTIFGSRERRTEVSNYIQKISDNVNISIEDFQKNRQKYKDYDTITYFERYIKHQKLPSYQYPIQKNIENIESKEEEVKVEENIDNINNIENKKNEDPLECNILIEDPKTRIIPAPEEVSGAEFASLPFTLDDLPNATTNISEDIMTSLTDQIKKVHTLSIMYHYILENFKSLSATSIVNNENNSGMKDLSSFSTYLLREELSKKKLGVKTKINYGIVEKIVKKLKFFAGFEEQMRFKILEAGEYHFFSKGETIFKQKEIGDSMYVILHGSVYVKINDNTVNTLFDGFSFGEKCLIRSQYHNSGIKEEETINMRDASIVTAEDSDLLMISKQKFSEIIFKEIKNDLHAKIKILKHCKYFSSVDPYALVIMALNIKIERYKYGEILVEQGRIPKETFVLIEGQTKAVYNHYITRPKVAIVSDPKYKIGIQPPPFRFAYKEYGRKVGNILDQKCKLGAQKVGRNSVDNFSANQSFQNDIKKDKRRSSRPQTAGGRRIISKIRGKSKEEDNSLVNYRGDKLTYTNHIEFNKIIEGEAFCIRSMLSTKAIKIELKHNSKFQNTEIERRITGENRAERIEEWKYNHLMTSQLTIIADSAEVKVMSINQSTLGYLHPSVLDKLVIDLLPKVFTDFDRPYLWTKDLKKIISNQKDWNKYKLNLEKNILTEMVDQKYSKQLFSFL